MQLKKSRLNFPHLPRRFAFQFRVPEAMLVNGCNDSLVESFVRVPRPRITPSSGKTWFFLSSSLSWVSEDPVLSITRGKFEIIQSSDQGVGWCHGFLDVGGCDIIESVSGQNEILEVLRLSLTVLAIRSIKSMNL